jgi:putative phage-type endonuclease
MKIYEEGDLPQGSDPWLALRKKFGTASEAAAAMGVSPWVPKTPLQLWELKNGEREIKSNFAMENGNRYEDEAREAYQAKTHTLYEPCCVVDTIDGLPLMASLDGKQIGGDSILEIKVPLNGSCSPLWAEMENDEDLPIQYQIQMQQQMLVSQESKCEFWVYDWKNKRGLHRTVNCDKEVQQQIKDAWREYFKGKPDAGDKDVVARSDKEWKEASTNWDKANKELKAAQELIKACRASLIDLCNDKSYEGNKVRCKRNHTLGTWTVRNVKC